MPQLPAEIDFAYDPLATPERMNRAMDYLVSRLRGVEALQPSLQAALDEVRAIGIDRVTEALTPLILQAQSDAADLGSLLAGLSEGTVLEDFYTKLQSDARYAALVHGHDVADIADLASALTGYALAAHGHGMADVTGLAAALALLAPLDNPALTGNPTAPTQAAGNNSTRLASTAFVATAIANLVASSPAALDTLNELAAALGNDANFAATMTTALAGKAASAHGHAQGDVTGLVAALALLAPLASPTFTGTPAAPTAAVGTNTTQIATTALVKSAIDALIERGTGVKLAGFAVPAKGQGSSGAQTPSINLTGLTGGEDTAARAGDLVIVAVSVGASTDLNLAMTTAGYAEVADLSGVNGSVRSNLGIYWKVMGASPDATAQASIPANGSSGGYEVLGAVLRGADPANPIDVAAVTVVSNTSILADPGAVTPLTGGTMILAIAAGASNGPVAGNYTVTGAVAQSVEFFDAPTHNSACGIGVMLRNPIAAVDPAAWTSAATDTSGSHCVVTLAIRAA